MKHRPPVLALLLLTAPPLVLAQSSAEPEHTASTVTGTVTYRQRIALPPDAVVRLVIEDVSLAGAPAKSIAEEQVPTNGKQVPIPFDVKYDPAVLNPSHRYQIRATITSGGELLFTSATSYPVLTQGAPEKHIGILVQQAPPEPPGAKPAAPLTGTHWTLTQLNGETVKPGSGRSEAWIELAADTQRLAGSGGCNRLMGSYELDGSTLRFRQVASTMMACPGDVMPGEQALLKALSATTSFRIRGSTLLLRGDDNTVLARLTAQTQPKAATP
jgi:putative lipoprotein